MSREPVASESACARWKVSRAIEAELASAPPAELYLVAHRELRQVPRVAAAWDFLTAQIAGAPVEPRTGRRRPRRDDL